MNDRLKYRVYDTVDREYVECDVIRLTPYGAAVWTEKNEPKINLLRYVIEFCTGIKDKSGKLIYENDLIDFYGKTYQIVWDNDFACFSIKNNNSMHPISDITQSSVMSNIHENPEILNV